MRRSPRPLYLASPTVVHTRAHARTEQEPTLCAILRSQKQAIGVGKKPEKIYIKVFDKTAPLNFCFIGIELDKDGMARRQNQVRCAGFDPVVATSPQMD